MSDSIYLRIKLEKIFFDIETSKFLFEVIKEGCSRSIWNLPEFFREIPITYNAKAWKEDGFHSAAKGQEFVFEANYKAEEWIRRLLNEATVK